MALFSFVVAACTTTPAKISRDKAHRRVDGTLGELLDQALNDPESHHAAHALSHFVGDWFVQRERASSGEIVEGDRRFRVRYVDDRTACYLPEYFDQLEPTVEFDVDKIERHQRHGVGAPMLALRENRGREPIEKFYPPEAITRPITAVAFEGAPSDGYRNVTVRLLCPLYSEEIRFAGKLQPLAADFTAPWAALVGRGKELKRSGIRDALGKMPKRDPQLYLMEPYDPNKEPLIMIHGLFGTPLKWAELSNDLWADDEIRRRYQIWHYLYNTSAPALYSGRILRTQLRELRPMLDPGLNDPAMRSTTLVVHSMGGIVARSLISRPGNVFWDAAFTRPLESLTLSDQDRATLKEAFFWEPEAQVKRVVFVGVPHRGSDIADSFFGKLGRRFVKPPNKFREFYERISEANPGAFTEAYAELGTGKLDSVHALSPKQVTLQILPELPVQDGVVMHSIIGNHGKPGLLEDSHDGLVPYWSSHLDEAASEKVVDYGHEVFRHPEGIAEIERILKLP